jgi:hypothetical protein
MDGTLSPDTLAPNEALVFWVYQLASYVTRNLMDDAAMLAFVFC